MPVHVFGNPCEVEALEGLARGNGLKLIFDSAHAVGASYKGRKIGNFGDAETFSFHATKVLPMAEAGGIALKDPALAEDLRAARVFGDYGDHDCRFAGTNAKMQEFSAILGLYALERLDENIRRRDACVRLYRETLGHLPGITFQKLNPDGQSSHQNFAMLIEPKEFGLSRDELFDALASDNIMARKYFFPAIHLQKAYHEKPCSLPATEDIAARVLCLPLHNHMPMELAERVLEAIMAIHRDAPAIRRKLAGG
jgi:dTDP-4-amino-4,6-dideoxygalactose transaminase